MKIRLSTIVTAVAVLSISCASFAQGGGGRQPGGRGPGMGMRGMMGNLNDRASMLLTRTDVQADLKLTDEQNTKLKAVQDKLNTDRRKLFTDLGQDATQEQRDAAMKSMQKLNEDAQKEINAILTADQQKRLKQINVQLAKNSAILFTDMQKELVITDKQKESIKTLQTKMTEANQAIRDKVRNQEITNEDAMKLYQKNSESMNTELGKLLTEDQAKKLKDMQGDPFKADKKYENMGMGGRMGGGGNRTRGGGGGGGGTRGGGGTGGGN